jgi:hypothetical protein
MTGTFNNSTKDKSSPQIPQQKLHYPDDPQYLWLLLTALIGRKYYIRRPSKYHIKHRDVNFFWTTGVITTDDGIRHPEKGQFALVALLEKLYPKNTPPSYPDSPFAKVLTPILDINLDDEAAPDVGEGEPKADDDDLPW